MLTAGAEKMLSQETERRIDFALCSLNHFQDRFEELEENLSLLEYAISLISKRIDELEKLLR